MAGKSRLQAHEYLHKKDDVLVEAEYIFDEPLGRGKVRQHRVCVKRGEFERVAHTAKKLSLPFEDFVIIARVLLMGQEADKDITEAFRLLDADDSGTIDISELSMFMPALIPNANQYMLLRYFQPADTNNDYKLSFEEFSAFVKKGVLRDVAIESNKVET